jgi:glycosyltransferase 2 family protein
MKKSALHFLRIAFTTTLLLYVFYQAGLLSAQGWQDLWGTFSRANRWLLLGSVLMVPLIDFVSAIKWYCLARATGLPVGLGRLYAYYIVGSFFNLVLPSSIGGDVVRIHELGRYTGRYADSAAVVFVERFSGLAMLVLLTAIAVVVNLQTFHLPWLTVTLIIGLLGVGLVCWVIIDARPFNFLDHNLGHRIPLVASFLKKLGKFRTAVLVYKDKPKALWIAVFNSLLFYFLAIGNVWISALAFDSSVSFVTMLVAVPVIMFIMNLPFSIGGLGLMEFAYSFTLGLFGINPAVAISTALLMRLKTLLTAGMGSFIYPMVSDGRGSPQQLVQSINPHEDSRS